MQKHFPLWLNCINTPTLRNHAPLSRDIYEAGIETLFNTETTRLVQDEASQGSIEGALNKLVRSQSENILASLSQMFRSFVVFSRRSRVAPPGQVSNSEVGSKTEQSRSLSMSFFVTCDGLLSQIPEGNQVWTARVALLSIVDSENLFDSRDDVSKKVLMENGEYAIRYLSSLPRGELCLFQKENLPDDLQNTEMKLHLPFKLCPS